MLDRTPHKIRLCCLNLIFKLDLLLQKWNLLILRVWRHVVTDFDRVQELNKYKTLRKHKSSARINS